MLIQVGGLGLTTANPYFAAQEPGAACRGSWRTRCGWPASGSSCMVAGALIKLAAPGVARGARLGSAPRHARGHPRSARRALPAERAARRGTDGRLQRRRGDQAALTLAALAGRLRRRRPALHRHARDPRPGTLRRAVRVCRATRAALAHRRAVRRRLARSMLELRLPGLRRDPQSRSLVIRLDLLLVNAYLGRTGRALLGRRDTRGRDVRPADGGRPQPLPRVARGDPTKASAEVFRSVAVLYGLFCLATVPLAGSRFARSSGTSSTERPRCTTGSCRASIASGC